MERSQITVLGAGTIGASWASLFLAWGHDVVLWDPDPRAEARFSNAVQIQISAVRRLCNVPDREGRWWFRPTAVEAVAGSDFVQENGPEDLERKRELYSAIEPNLRPSAIVASSTSSLMPSVLQAGVSFSGRLLVGHPFNPPHLIPLVEVVGGEATYPAVVEQAMAFYRGLGKHPIRLQKERLGHVANRLQAALWREAVETVAIGAASVADVDAAVTHALGPRWALLGPHAIFHLAGGDGGIRHFVEHLGPAFVAQWRDLQEPSLTDEVAQALAAGIDEEFGGRSPDDLVRERDERLVRLLIATPPISTATSFEPEVKA